MSKRILLKLSGETIMGEQPFGIDPEACNKLAMNLKLLKSIGFELSLVIGGGNICRGMNLAASGVERFAADQMGMLATLMNAIAIEQSLRKLGVPAKVMSALECPKIAQTYQISNAKDYLSQGNILIFSGGTGNPYFTTDTAASLRACEIGADLLLKATNVDGIYNEDPKKNRTAQKLTSISYVDVLAKDLKVIDATCVAMCRDNKIPIVIFNKRILNEISEDFLSDIKRRGSIISE